MPSPRRTAILVLAATALLAQSASAETRTTLAQLPNETDVKVLGSRALLNVQDPTTKQFSLQLLSDGTLSALPIAPSATPIDADLGSDSAGRPTVVLSSCSDPTKPADPGAGSAPATVGNCDLQILRVGVDSAPQPIANANSAGSEYAPTLWRGTLAFARSYAANGTPVVYTKSLLAPRSRPSTRQPGVPSRRCSVQFESGDCTTRSRTIDGLELYGDHLAEDVGYVVDKQAGFATEEIRLVGVAKRTSSLVALSTSGEGGQSYVGLGFDAGRLGWNRSCFGDPGGCTGLSGGAFRYRYSTVSYEHAGPNRQLAGFALTPSGTLQDVGTTSELGDGSPTTLVATGPLDWQPVDGARVK